MIVICVLTHADEQTHLCFCTVMRMFTGVHLWTSDVICCILNVRGQQPTLGGRGLWGEVHIDSSV